MEGLHLTADCFDCQCPSALMLDIQYLRSNAIKATEQAGLSIVGEKFHAFSTQTGDPAGITGTLLLAESHLAIHTWPERNAVTLDVYVCNFNADNSMKARRLMDRLITQFRPKNSNRQELMRGVAELTETVSGTAGDTTGNIAIEYLTPDTVYGTRLGVTIASVQSAFQQIDILHSPDFGKMMRIDGAYMTSEKDEFFYHECLVHPVAIAHPAPHSALIIGGGDGGSTEELLKHPSIQHIDLCEIDASVIELARAHLKPIHRGALDDSRVKHIHEDGFAFVKNAERQYDVIFLDLTDPISPNGNELAASCMTADFFVACKRRLAKNGALVMHLGSPFYHPQRVADTYAALAKIFTTVRPYTVFIPLYGALWGMAIASDDLDPIAMTKQEIGDRMAQRKLTDLQYYNTDIHHALFALPTFVQNIVTKEIQ